MLTEAELKLAKAQLTLAFLDSSLTNELVVESMMSVSNIKEEFEGILKILDDFQQKPVEKLTSRREPTSLEFGGQSRE